VRRRDVIEVMTVGRLDRNESGIVRDANERPTGDGHFQTRVSGPSQRQKYSERPSCEKLGNAR
jgi:hypothetical protein